MVIFNQIQETKKRSNFVPFIAVCVTVLFSFFLYNTFKNSVFLVLAIFLMLLSLVLFDDLMLFYSIAIYVPNIMMMKLITSDSALVSYYVFLVCIRYFIKNKMLVSPVIFVHCFSVFITCILYKDFSLILACFRSIVFLIYLMNFLKKAIKEINFRTVIALFITGAFLNCLFGLAYYTILGKNLFDQYSLFGGIGNDRNYFASLVAIAIVLSLLLARNIKHVIILLPVCAIMLLCGLISASRTFLLAMIPTIIMLILFIFKKEKNKIAIVIFTFGFLILFIFKDFFSQAFNKVAERFDSSDVMTGNSRLELWVYYIKLVFSSPIRLLFGNGPGTQYINSFPIDGQYAGHVEHNTFVQSLSNLGLIGFVSLVLSVISVYRGAFKKQTIGKAPIYCYGPALTGIIFFSSINCLYSTQFDFYIFLSVVCVFCGKNQDYVFEGRNKCLAQVNNNTDTLSSSLKGI